MGRVSLTADTWSDQSYNSYLAVTAHWVAQVDGTSALQLKTALIAFHRLEEDHTGQTLAATMMELLDRAGITLKVRQTTFFWRLMDAYHSTRGGTYHPRQRVKQRDHDEGTRDDVGRSRCFL